MHRRKSIWNQICMNPQGSFTVEASMIMGLVLLVIFFVLFLGAYVHGNAVLTSSAYEQSVTGRMQELPSLFGLTSVQLNQSFGEDENQVTGGASCRAILGGYTAGIQVEASYKKEKPVTFIRNAQALGTMTGLGGG